MSVKNHAEGWPGLTTRYIEHYYWEPQHFNRVRLKAKADKRPPKEVLLDCLGSQEVPLNFLFNVFLRIAPSPLHTACLNAFGLTDIETGRLCLRTPIDWEYIQPDVHLESEIARVFIEIKIDARLTLEQVQKYVLLHGRMDREETEKRAYVLFLTKSPKLQLHDIQISVPHCEAAKNIPAILQQHPLAQNVLKHDQNACFASTCQGVTFASTTWASVADAIEAERQRLAGRDMYLDEMIEACAGDLLAELERRQLWMPRQ